MDIKVSSCRLCSGKAEKMDNRIEKKRIGLYLAFTFVLSWGILAVMKLTDMPSTPTLLLTVLYGFLPGLCSLLTRALTKEGYKNMMLRLNIKENKRHYAAALCSTYLAALLGVVLYLIIEFNSFRFDRFFGMNPFLLILILAALLPLLAAMLFVYGMFLSPLSLGGTLGWFGYLLPKLEPRGTRRAILITGFIWGVWRIPLELMNADGSLWVCAALTVLYSVAFGCALSYFVLKLRSVWPAAFMAGVVSVINSLAPQLFTREVRFLGPQTTGIAGMAGILILGALCLITVNRSEPPIKKLRAHLCIRHDLTEVFQLAQRLNGNAETGSSFCSNEPRTLLRECSRAIEHEYAAACWAREKMRGALVCRPDPENHRVECSLFIDPELCDFTVAADVLLSKMRGKFGGDNLLIFSIPAENTRCAAYLEAAGAEKQPDGGYALRQDKAEH